MTRPALQTALALPQAIWRKTDPAWPVCGLPAALYSDHGSDFISDHMAQVCADVKVQLIHGTPETPRTRQGRTAVRHHHYQAAADAARSHPEDMEALETNGTLTRHDFHGEWNYTLTPGNQRHAQAGY